MTIEEFQKKYGDLADGEHLPEEEVCLAGSPLQPFAEWLAFFNLMKLLDLFLVKCCLECLSEK